MTSSWLFRLADLLLVPFVYPCAWILRNVRHAGVQNLPLCRGALMRVGVFPVRNHYYEPQFDNRHARRAWSEDRVLPGIDWNIDGQLRLLESFRHARELDDVLSEKIRPLEFHFNNGTFEAGDAEYWYQLIRTIKPRRIFEIGAGYSTLMAIRAIRRNHDEDPAYLCRHVCVEPYEMRWLEETGVEVVRKRVEDLDIGFSPSSAKTTSCSSIRRT